MCIAVAFSGSRDSKLNIDCLEHCCMRESAYKKEIAVFSDLNSE